MKLSPFWTQEKKCVKEIEGEKVEEGKLRDGYKEKMAYIVGSIYEKIGTRLGPLSSSKPGGDWYFL